MSQVQEQDMRSVQNADAMHHARESVPLDTNSEPSIDTSEVSATDEEKEWDAGFYMEDTVGTAEGADSEKAHADAIPAEPHAEQSGEAQNATHQTESRQQPLQDAIQQVSTPQSVQQPDIPQVQQQKPYAPQENIQEQKRTVEIPAEIKDEWAVLQRQSPEAAALAVEDSVEGEQVRQRLSEFGATVAFDRAEVVLERRKRAVLEKQREDIQNQRLVEEHNRYFTSVLQREHPEYLAMMQDHARRAEAQATVNDIFAWIGSKPYSEGEKLMPIARSGRDPMAISALLSQYERERNVKIGSRVAEQQRQQAKPRVDPTGAMAVPSRGASVMPTGIGDKDSFDAGWELSEKLERAERK